MRPIEKSTLVYRGGPDEVPRSIRVVHGVPHRDEYSKWVVQSGVPHRQGYYVRSTFKLPSIALTQIVVPESFGLK